MLQVRSATATGAGCYGIPESQESVVYERIQEQTMTWLIAIVGAHYLYHYCSKQSDNAPIGPFLYSILGGMIQLLWVVVMLVGLLAE